MCGPLALRFSGANQSLTSVLYYHAGRILVYAFLGLIAGLIGKSLLSLFPVQQFLSIIAGFFMLIMWALSTRNSLLMRLASPFIQFLSRFSASQKTGIMKSFFQGVLNGVLPCGLVYIAMAASLGVGDLGGSVLYMAIFGWGTAPALLLIQLLGQNKKILHVLRINYWLPVLSFATALLLILRGLNLDIPHISPAFHNDKAQVVRCH
jgi:sulfite exporter TauE/SafE